MFDGGGNDVAFAWLSDERAVDRGVIAFSAATRENDFLRVGMDQGGELFAGFFDVVGDLFAKRIGAGWVAPLVLEKGEHGLDHLRGDPGGGVVVQITKLALAHDKCETCGPVRTGASVAARTI